MAIGSIIASAIANYGVQKVGNWLYNKVWGGSKEGASGAKTAGGDDPEFERNMEENAAPMMEEYSQNPEVDPELSKVISQYHKVFGTTPESQRTDQFDFDPIAAKAMQQFQGEILPGLAERFTSITGGGQRSGAFARQTTQAGESLAGGLAALRSQMQPEMAFKRGQLELAGRGQRLSELGFLAGQKQPGFWQQAAPGIGAALGGLGQAAGQAGSYWLGKKYGFID